MKLDPDIKNMTGGQARKELMRLRHKFKTNARRTNNACCWELDESLYAEVLGRRISLGKIDLSEEEFLRHCRRFYRRRKRAQKNLKR